MVQVIQHDVQPKVISEYYSWKKVGLIGVLVGVLWWVITYGGLTYIIEPILCKGAVSISSCSNPLDLSSDIASILAGAVGLGILVRQRILRPIIVALATAATLWGFAGLADGLSVLEILGWSGVLYGLSYILFSWISRYAISIPVMLAATCIVIVARIATAL